MRWVFNNFSFERTWGSYMALSKDSLLLVDSYGMGVVWSLHALEIMAPLYDEHPNSEIRRYEIGHLAKFSPQVTIFD